jgi:hypothetical protein
MFWRKHPKGTLSIWKFQIGAIEREIEPGLFVTNRQAVAVGHTALEAREKLIEWARKEQMDIRWLKVASVIQLPIEPSAIAWAET